MIKRNNPQRRLIRTIVLGTIAMVAGLAWLADALDIDTGELFGFAASGLLMVAVVVVLAMLGAAILRGLRYLFRRH